MITLEQGIEAFCSGFTYTRSFTHPYIYQRTDTFWQMKDGPRQSGDRRGSEVITTLHDPEQVINFMKGLQGDRLFLCVMHDVATPEAPIIKSFKASGCRLMRREPMMVKALDTIEPLTGPYPVTRIVDAEGEEKITNAARTRQILPEHVHDGDADLRLFAAWDGETPVGWVKSIRATKDHTWVSNMFVKSEYRRQGIGRSLMSAMLQSDQHYRFTHSVLLASQAGTKLYETLGYERIGTLLLLDPKLALAQ